MMEEDVRELENLSISISSLNKIRAMAAIRLTIQKAPEITAQAAVMPPRQTEAAGTTQATVLPTSLEANSAPQADQRKKFENIQPRPKPLEQQPLLIRLYKKCRSKN